MARNNEENGGCLQAPPSQDAQHVQAALRDPQSCCVALISPTVRVVWGETLGLPLALANTGRLIAALHQLGFTYVFNTAAQASSSVRLMAQELRELSQKCASDDKTGSLPLPTFPDTPLASACRNTLFSATCPDWVQWLKREHPELSDRLSSAGSPSRSLTEEVRNFVARSSGAGSADSAPDARETTDYLCVTVTGCLAKKPAPGAATGDTITLTTAELQELLAASNLDFTSLPEEPFDEPYAKDFGWGLLISAPGGVAEAVLHELLPGPDDVLFSALRQDAPLVECSITLGDQQLRLAAVNGLENIEELLTGFATQGCPYDFIECMTCTGSCVNGLGQPHPNTPQTITTRTESLRSLADAPAKETTTLPPRCS